MDTTHIAARLYDLQLHDLEIERLMGEELALASSLQDTSLLKKLRAELAASQKALSDGLQVQKEAEWALEELERRLQQHQQRLYGGSVTNAKELTALQQEVQHLRAQQEHQEERVLETMEAADELRARVEERERAVNQAEQSWKEANAAGVARREQLELRLRELRASRAELATTLDSKLVRRYEGMRKAKQGRVVSKIDQNSCQWCRVILTASELQRVRVSTELQTCSNCGRILYYDR